MKYDVTLGHSRERDERSTHSASLVAWIRDAEVKQAARRELIGSRSATSAHKSME